MAFKEIRTLVNHSDILVHNYIPTDSERSLKDPSGSSSQSDAMKQTIYR